MSSSLASRGARPSLVDRSWSLTFPLWVKRTRESSRYFASQFSWCVCRFSVGRASFDEGKCGRTREAWGARAGSVAVVQQVLAIPEDNTPCPNCCRCVEFLLRATTFPRETGTANRERRVGYKAESSKRRVPVVSCPCTPHLGASSSLGGMPLSSSSEDVCVPALLSKFTRGRSSRYLDGFGISGRFVLHVDAVSSSHEGGTDQRLQVASGDTSAALMGTCRTREHSIFVLLDVSSLGFEPGAGASVFPCHHGAPDNPPFLWGARVRLWRGSCCGFNSPSWGYYSRATAEQTLLASKESQ